jgi:hypothetical protein
MTRGGLPLALALGLEEREAKRKASLALAPRGEQRADDDERVLHIPLHSLFIITTMMTQNTALSITPITITPNIIFFVNPQQKVSSHLFHQ